MKRSYGAEEVELVAKEILENLPVFEDKATVLLLQGELGAGKTTLTQSITKLLGVQETVVSPTFVIAKFYRPTQGVFETLIHIDAYRIESTDELNPLGWNNMITSPRTLLIVEWPERIQEALPSDALLFSITHQGELRTIETHEK